MSNGLIPKATLVGTVSGPAAGIFDHLAYVWQNKALLGPGGLPMFGLLSALDNADVTAAGIEDAARIGDQRLEEAAWYDTAFQDLLNRIIKHLQAEAIAETSKVQYADIDAYLTGQAIRVHKAFADLHLANLGVALSAANVFDAAGVILGTINWSGTGAGTLTDGAAVAVGTGGNDLRWRIPVGKSVTSSVVTLTLVLPDETTEEQAVTIVGAAGVVGAIGTPATDWYVDLESIVIESGGANGNQAVIETVCDRDPAEIG